jgi:hypothetical protein
MTSSWLASIVCLEPSCLLRKEKWYRGGDGWVEGDPGRQIEMVWGALVAVEFRCMFSQGEIFSLIGSTCRL